MGQGGAGSWKLEAGSWKLEAGSWKVGFRISSFLRHLNFDIRPRRCVRRFLPAHPCSVVSSVAVHSTTTAPISVGLLCVFATWHLCVKQRRARRRGDRETFNAKARRRKDAKRRVERRHCQPGKPDLRIWTRSPVRRGPLRGGACRVPAPAPLRPRSRFPLSCVSCFSWFRLARPGVDPLIRGL